MNKKSILLTALIAGIGFVRATNDNEPVHIKNGKEFFKTSITFNDSQKTIGRLIGFNDLDADKVDLLHELNNGYFEDLGTIGYPKNQSQFDPTAKILVLLREKSGYLCDAEKCIVVTDREDLRNICTRAAQYRDMKKEIKEKTEEDVLKISP